MKHGKPAAILLSVAEYEAIRKTKKSLFAASRDCPEDLGDFLPERSREKTRAVEF